LLTLQQSISPGRSSLYRCFSPNDYPCSWRKKLAAAVKYAWIHQQRPEFTVSRMCRLLAVSRSGYYEWLSRPPCAQTEAEQALQDMITRYCAQGRGTYGTRRLKHLLAQEGLQVSRRRIGRVLVVCPI